MTKTIPPEIRRVRTVLLLLRRYLDANGFDVPPASLPEGDPESEATLEMLHEWVREFREEGAIAEVIWKPNSEFELGTREHEILEGGFNLKSYTDDKGETHEVQPSAGINVQAGFHPEPVLGLPTARCFGCPQDDDVAMFLEVEHESKGDAFALIRRVVQYFVAAALLNSFELDDDYLGMLAREVDDDEGASQWVVVLPLTDDLVTKSALEEMAEDPIEILP